MPKQMKPEEKRRIEASILPEKEVDKYEWPIKVTAIGQTAKLRLIRGKPRITCDWSVPGRLRAVIGSQRVTRVIPAPAGHSTKAAVVWAREWLHGQVLAAENALARGGLPDPSSEIDNDVSLGVLLERFRNSKKYRRQGKKSEQSTDQWDLWMDFFLAMLGEDWRLYRVSPDVAWELHEAYQEPWVRKLPDGSTKLIDTRPGHNTAAKVTRFLKTVCNWAVGEPIPGGGYILDKDPFARFRPGDLPRERKSEARATGVASDDYAIAMYEHGVKRGKTRQFGTMFGIEAVQGRRNGEIRLLPRPNVLTDLESVLYALEFQGCRAVLPDQHIPDDELERAAEAYLSLSGVVLWYRQAKQAAAKPDAAAQHDRVTPLGPWAGSLLLSYIREDLDPRALGPMSPLFPAVTRPTEPSSKSTVLNNWWQRTEESVIRSHPEIRIPEGRTHTLRRRLRNRMKDQPRKALAFWAGWTLSGGQAMEGYLNVTWQDVVQIAQVADERLKCVR